MISTMDFAAKQTVFVFTNKGQKLSFQNDNLILKDSSNKIVMQTTCYRIFCVFIIGNLSLTTGIIQRAHKFNFAIVLMTVSMRPYQIIGYRQEGNTLLRKRQYAYDGLGLAKYFIQNKIQNQRALLNKQRNKSSELKKAIGMLEQYNNKVCDAKTLQEIMGYEGLAAKVYFQNHFDNIEWTGRKPRIKPDMINSLLDMGYTLLFSFTEAILSIYGFDLYNGFLHKFFYMRKSLVCDFVEPFRVLIDDAVKKGINLRQFKKEDFWIDRQRFDLQWKKSAEYTAVLMQPILDNKNKIFLYIQSFYRAFTNGRTVDFFPRYDFASGEVVK